MSMARTATLMALLLSASCASAPPPRPPAPVVAAPTPIVAAPRPPSEGPATLVQVAARVTLDDAPDAPVFEELPRRFEVVRLPRKVTGLVAVSGRGERDVWMLGDRQELLRWQGSSLAVVKTPSCPFVADFRRIGGAVMRTEPFYDTLAVLPGSVAVLGKRHEYGTRGSYAIDIEARTTDTRRWSCIGNGYPSTLRSMAGDAEIGVWRSSGHDGPVWIDGRQAPLPEAAKGVDDLSVAGRSAADLWLWNGSAAVWHFDGLAWQPRPLPTGTAVDLWVDAGGAAWVLGAGHLQRWDGEAGAWRRLPFAVGEDAFALRGVSAREVWIFGKTRAALWNGRELRRGELPVEEIHAAWVSAAGEVWVVGTDPAELVTVETDEGRKDVRAGIVLRAPVPAKGRP
jgi:hypothetical protein